MTHKLTFETIEGLTIAVLRTDDGYMFTTADWQGQQPEILDDVPEYNWCCVDPDDPANTYFWSPAIMFPDGLPRIIE